ncbi:hypothetical protein AgCh_028376 [Apium graveolens]
MLILEVETEKTFVGLTFDEKKYVRWVREKITWRTGGTNGRVVDLYGSWLKGENSREHYFDHEDDKKYENKEEHAKGKEQILLSNDIKNGSLECQLLLYIGGSRAFGKKRGTSVEDETGEDDNVKWKKKAISGN